MALWDSVDPYRNEGEIEREVWCPVLDDYAEGVIHFTRTPHGTENASFVCPLCGAEHDFDPDPD